MGKLIIHTVINFLFILHYTTKSCFKLCNFSMMIFYYSYWYIINKVWGLIIKLRCFFLFLLCPCKKNLDFQERVLWRSMAIQVITSSFLLLCTMNPKMSILFYFKKITIYHDVRKIDNKTVFPWLWITVVYVVIFWLQFNGHWAIIGDINFHHSTCAM